MVKSPPFDERAKGIALVLAAHGSPGAPGTKGDDLPSLKLQRRLQDLKIFARVECGFMEHAPFIADVVNSIDATEILVVPVMACDGYIAGTKLPKMLGLSGPVSERIGRHGRQRVQLSAPVGTDAAIPALIIDLLNRAMTAKGLDATQTTALIVGHGSMRSRASFEQTNAIAEAIKAQGFAAEIKSAFLEEPPRIDDWQNLSERENILVLPVMISDGHHGTEDIPNAISITPDAHFNEALATGVAGPYPIEGRHVYMAAPMGEAPELAQLIVDMLTREI